MIRAGRLVVSDLRSVIKRSRFESEPSAVVAQLMLLREKFPNTEFFLVRVQENTDTWTLFTQCV